MVIAFHGTSSGIGATHAALMCAYHLSAGELGRAAYVDARDEADGAVIRALEADYEGEEPDSMDSRKTAGDAAEGVRLHGVTCYRWTQGNLLPYLLGRYEYVVLDTGADATGRRIEEFERAQIPVLVGSASPGAGKSCARRPEGSKRTNARIGLQPSHMRMPILPGGRLGSAGVAEVWRSCRISRIHSSGARMPCAGQKSS